MQKIIFYGIGSDTATYLKEYEEHDYKIMCFIDNNEALWHTKISLNGSEYNILPPREALEKHGFLNIYSTTTSWGEVNLSVKYGIPRDQIRHCAGRTYRRSCGQLINNLLIGSNSGFKPCCYKTATSFLQKQINTPADWIDAYHEYTQIKAQVLRSAERNEFCLCDGCPRMVYDFYPTDMNIKNLNYTGDFHGERCNVKCIYCNRANKVIDNQTEDEFFSDTNFNIVDPLEAMADFLPKNLTITDSTSEITVSKHRKRFFNLIRERNWLLSPILSSCLLYDDDVAYFLSKGASLDCSLDCGTRETYKKIKRIDGFDSVVRSLKKYREHTACISLKYILLEGFNDNMSDINGFMEVAKEVASFVRISFDARKSTSDVTSNMFRHIEYFVKSAQQHGVVYSRKLQVHVVKEDDYRRIVSILAQ